MVYPITKEVLLTRICKWAAGNVLVELDYQEELLKLLSKKQNNELQQAFGIQGFPIYFANGIETEGKVNFEV
jgi:protein disulfide-isomerase